MSQELKTQETAEPQSAPTPAAAPLRSPAPRRPFEDFEADEERGAGRRKVIIGIALLAAVGGVVLVAKNLTGGSSAPAPREQNITSVQLPPPLPPPPPKTTPPPPKIEEVKKEMIVQDDVKDDEKKPDNEPPPAPMAKSSIVGKGGDASIGTSGTANPFGGLGKKAGSKFGWYAGPVQSRVAEALRTNKATRSAKLEGVLVKIWPDSNARIGRVEIKSGSGQPAIDEAIRQALLGLALAEPPPADMPLPIVLRLSARAGLTAQR